LRTLRDKGAGRFDVCGRRTAAQEAQYLSSVTACRFSDEPFDGATWCCSTHRIAQCEEGHDHRSAEHRDGGEDECKP
jgi:hypothetical protein